MKKLFLTSAFLFLTSALLLGQAFTFSDIPFLSSGSTDWERRVIANGGARPSANTVQAMEVLRKGCIAAGLTNKIYSLCVFVPDSLIAASTPLFLHKGYPMWTNSNFLTADLNINGLKGDGTTKALDTGCMAKALSAGGVSDTSDGSRGLTVIVTEGETNAATVQIGFREADDTSELLLGISTSGVTQFLPSTASASFQLLTNDWARVGYVSANIWNDANTNNSIYVASPLEAHKVFATKVIPAAIMPAPTSDGTISVFASKHGTTNFLWSAARMSMAMVHDGFTSAESATLWPLFRACRETLGGGTGDNVHDWNTKIVAAGGANISTTTSNAARTFLSGLDTDGTLYTMVVANVYPPDNLTAARTPLIWQAGNQIWANVNFGTTNLTVNGLTGNLTDKHLGTGINPNLTVNRGYSVTSAGISLMIFASNLGDGSYVEMGSAGSGANVFTALQSFRGNLAFYCWGVSLVNQNFVTRNTSPLTTNWNGFLSGNRTAANAIALYRATGGGGAHEVFTNATGAQSLAKTTITNMAAHASFTLASVANNWSDRTVSFMALHSGQTQTQNSNLWNRVVTMRTAFGGGAP